MKAGLRSKSLSAQILAIGVVFALEFFILGCGKKEKQMAVPQVSTPAQARELPELEQNKIFLTNRLIKTEPADYSYQETKDGLEPLPLEAPENSPPPVD